jgi:hypothetical protein
MGVSAQGSSVSDRLEKQEREEQRLTTESDKAKHYHKFPDMSWRDHLVMLLQFGAAAEHCLMVQYLYAAYSMRTDDEDARRREMVENWRAQILTVAREEMGHLLTVQNVLLLLGAPVGLGREDSLWAHSYYPYPFTLQPFGFEALACFIYAEMPENCDSDLRDEIIQILKKANKFPEGPPADSDLHRVGELYDRIIDLMSDSVRIPDSDFDGSSYEFQASWDEWGRGYKPGPRQLDAEGNRMPELDAQGNPVIEPPPGSEAIVEIQRMASRRDAIKALVALAAQGEAPHVARKPNVKSELRPQGKMALRRQDTDDAQVDAELSHFDRFVAIYRRLQEETAKTPGWSPSTGVCSDPTTRPDFIRVAEKHYGIDYAVIDAIAAKHLAQIFNQRYRLLLNYLAHVFRIARSHRVDRPNLRAMLMHRVFGEMYNLKTLAGMLVRLKRLDTGDDGKGIWAAPPFELPYTVVLPDAEADVWRLHDDLLVMCNTTCRHLLHYATTEQPKHRERTQRIKEEVTRTGAEAFVRTLMDIDEQTREWIGAILEGLSKGAESR